MITLRAFHGWGLSPDFWTALENELKDQVIFQKVDLGFIESPTAAPPPPSSACIALGHSLGFLYALKRKQSFDGYIAINGFMRFSRSDDFINGVDPRLIRRMKSRLQTSPAQVRNDFLVRCGYSATDIPAAPLNIDRLHEGLDWLLDWDERPSLPNVSPLLALSGAHDPIVPSLMSQALFPSECLVEHPEGGHLLPLTHPVWCARHILRFMDQLS